jgi:hypothetical protein
MAGIVQQLGECRNAATTNTPTKKNVAGRGSPATPFATGKKLSRLPGAGSAFGCGLSSNADSPQKF